MLRFSIRAHAAEDLDFAGLALSQEEVAVGSNAQQAGVIEAVGVEPDLKPLGSDGPGVCRTGNDRGAVIDRLLGGRGGQIGDGEMAADAG